MTEVTLPSKVGHFIGWAYSQHMFWHDEQLAIKTYIFEFGDVILNLHVISQKIANLEILSQPRGNTRVLWLDVYLSQNLTGRN